MLLINVLAVLQDTQYLIMLVWLVLYRTVLLAKPPTNALLVHLDTMLLVELVLHAQILTVTHVLLLTNAQVV